MLNIDKIYDRLQRKTTSTSFIPQIDGLRFLAIIWVVLFHINTFISFKVPGGFTKSPVDYFLINGIFVNDGRKGVLLFFVISGFILALPFAKQFWQQGKSVKLKQYFLRRLTRLEPPYMLTMLICYFAIILLRGHEFSAMFPRTYLGLLPSLASSLLYVHNIFLPHALSINQVSWSLEIEVQFYLLVPLLVLILKLPRLFRRSLLVFLILAFPFFQHWLQPTILTLFSFIQYFLLGFLLVDVYLSNLQVKWTWIISVPVGLISLAAIIYLDIYSSFYMEYLFIGLLFLFCILVLTCSFWKKLFSMRFITAVGGMCYSIYLWHNNVISAIGNFTIRFNVSRSYPVELLWHMAILLPAVLIFCTGFYLLIEQPCMDKDWPKKLWRFVMREKTAVVRQI